MCTPEPPRRGRPSVPLSARAPWSARCTASSETAKKPGTWTAPTGTCSSSCLPNAGRSTARRRLCSRPPPTASAAAPGTAKDVTGDEKHRGPADQGHRSAPSSEETGLVRDRYGKRPGWPRAPPCRGRGRGSPAGCRRPRGGRARMWTPGSGGRSSKESRAASRPRSPGGPARRGANSQARASLRKRRPRRGSRTARVGFLWLSGNAQIVMAGQRDQRRQGTASAGRASASAA